MTTNNRTIWAALLTAATVIGSYGLACVFPFAAISALAALTHDWRRGALLVAGAWLGNQIVGFTLLSYPFETQAFVWGGAILVAALAGFALAKRVCGASGEIVSWRAPAALVAAVAGYQALMFVWAVVLDGLASSTPAIVAQATLNDAIWFAVLSAGYLALTRFAGRRAPVSAI